MFRSFLIFHLQPIFEPVFRPLNELFSKFFPEFRINNQKLRVIGLFLNSRVLAFWISPTPKRMVIFNEYRLPCCPPRQGGEKIMKNFFVLNISAGVCKIIRTRKDGAGHRTFFFLLTTFLIFVEQILGRRNIFNQRVQSYFQRWHD